jgi:hypothetical protein
MFSNNTVRTSNLAYVICLDLLLEAVVVMCWLYQCQQALRCVTVIFMTFLNVQVALGLQQFVLWRFTVMSFDKIRPKIKKNYKSFKKCTPINTACNVNKQHSHSEVEVSSCIV